MSTVVLDTITGKSTATTITIGSTPVVSASANSMTIRGEGSAQTSIQQGLGKAWVNFTGVSTTAIRDSFNVASITDNGTGNTTITISAAMANINFSLAGMGGKATNDQYAIVQPRTDAVPTTTATIVNSPYDDADAGDALLNSVVYFGDLA